MNDNIQKKTAELLRKMPSMNLISAGIYLKTELSCLGYKRNEIDEAIKWFLAIKP
jgi:hypothetical protein